MSLWICYKSIYNDPGKLKFKYDICTYKFRNLQYLNYNNRSHMIRMTNSISLWSSRHFILCINLWVLERMYDVYRLVVTKSTFRNKQRCKPEYPDSLLSSWAVRRCPPSSLFPAHLLTPRPDLSVLQSQPEKECVYTCTFIYCTPLCPTGVDFATCECQIVDRGLASVYRLIALDERIWTRKCKTIGFQSF